MSEISGSKLKQIREERHIPLEQVAKATRIRLSILQDLESDEYADLGSRAQIRGFLKLYADFLGVPLEETAPQSPKEEDQPSSEEQPKQAIPEAKVPAEVKTSPKAKPSKKRESKPIRSRKKASTTPKAEKSAETLAPLPVSRSQQMLDDIGRQLNAHRRYLDIPWDLLVEQTHIPRAQLIALEQGNLDAFASPAEAKGLLQSYARFLNLNTDLLMVQFADALQERLAEKAASERRPRKRARLLSPRWVALRRFFTLDLFFGTLLVGGIIFFMVWGAAQLMNQPEALTEATNLPEIQEVLIGSPTPLGLEPTLTPTEGEPAFQLPTATPLSVPLDTTAPIQVVVHARQSVWVKVSADNKEVFQGRMSAGSVEAYTAEEFLEVEAGNAAALEIVYNQTQLDPFSRVGQLLRLRFDANGMQDISATPPYLPTPTQTSVP
jgi:cytoskeletal protein RodZ